MTNYTGLFVGVFTWFLVNIAGGKEITLASSTSIDPLLAGNIASLLTSLIVTLAVSAASKNKVNFYTNTLLHFIF